MDYNDPVSLPRYLTSLEGLNKLLVDRHNAGYARQETLDVFILQGRWVLDGCGNMGFADWPARTFTQRVLDAIILQGRWILGRFGNMRFADWPARTFTLVRDVFPNIPDVLTFDSYLDFIAPRMPRIYCEDKVPVGEPYTCVPPVGAVCVVCEEIFTLATAHTASSYCRSDDAVHWTVNPEFIGRTYQDLPRAFVGENGRFVIMKADAPVLRLNGERHVSLNLGYDYVLKSGDAMAYNRVYYTHHLCRKIHS
jgi:hypothetical protein